MIDDILALIGTASLAVGLWMLHPAIAYIVIGMMLVTYSIMCRRGVPK